MDLFLQIAQLLHVVGMDTHVSSQDGADHQFPQSLVLECTWPMATENLRVGCTVESL